jgi:hypothetical protein
MTNNPAFIDAVLAGAGGGAQISILASSDVGTYNQLAIAADVIALKVDAAIPPIAPGPTFSQINLMQSIAASVFQGRVQLANTGSVYTSIANTITVLYNTLAALLQNEPNVYPSPTMVLGGPYSSRPSPSVSGLLYICTDFPFVYRDTGSSWIQLVQSQSTTPPPTITSFTPINVTTLIPSVYADNIRVIGGATLVDALQYYQRGALTTGAGGIWTATIGLMNLDLSHTAKRFGLVFDDGTNYVSFHIFRSSSALWGLGQDCFDTNPTNRVARNDANVNFFSCPLPVYWIRVRFDGAVFNLETSSNGTTWVHAGSNVNLARVYGTVAGNCASALNWGFGVASDQGSSTTMPRLDAVVCHLTQTPTG